MRPFRVPIFELMPNESDNLPGIIIENRRKCTALSKILDKYPEILDWVAEDFKGV